MGMTKSPVQAKCKLKVLFNALLALKCSDLLRANVPTNRAVSKYGVNSQRMNLAYILAQCETNHKFWFSLVCQTVRKSKKSYRKRKLVLLVLNSLRYKSVFVNDGNLP